MRKRNVLMCAAAAVLMLGLLTGCNGNKQKETNAASSAESSGTEASTEAKKEGADIVLKNGLVQTMVNKDSTAQSVAIKGDKIVYVGDDAGVEAFISDKTEVIDLKGQMVAPGFMDGHIHAPGKWLTELYEIDLSQSTTNEEYLKVTKEFVEKNPNLEIYTGGRFMLNAYQKADGSNPGPQRTDLDAITTEKPIVIYDVAHHSIWCNTKALEMAGITKDTPDPKGGVIRRDEHGEVTGYLTDTAADLVNEKMPKIEYTEEQQVEAIKKFQEECSSYGITGITDIGERASLTVIDKLQKSGELNLRMRLAPIVEPGTDPKEAVARMEQLKKADSDMVKAGTVKLFYDGVTESGTAVMIEPYLEAAGKGDDWHGEAVWKNEADFDTMVVELDKAGLQVHVHAIGDGAVSKTLDSYGMAKEKNGERDSRHTITHVCAVTADDIKRFADLKVVSSLQFLWMYADPLFELEAAYIGNERALAMYPVKNMADAGCVIAGASDGPVTPYGTLDEIQVGVTRNSPYPEEKDTDMRRWPEQGLNAYQMLEAYTKNVAYQNFAEKEIGTVEVGKFADLVVLDQNILTIDPEDISDTNVVYTISNGRIVYKK